MKRQVLLAFFLNIVALHILSAQDEYKRTFLGINPAHTIAVSTISTLMDYNVTYVPIHIIVNHSFTKHFGISGLFLYRMERDYDFLTHEFGFAVGPSFLSNSLKGFYMDCKFGLAQAFGKDYSSNDYSRTDFVIQPDIGYYISFRSKFTLAVGLGLQSLMLLNESPSRNDVRDRWDWNASGKMSHYYLPVLNVSVGFTL